MTASRTLLTAMALLAVGTLAVIAIFVLAALDRQASWLWALSMAAPVGMFVGVYHVVRQQMRRKPRATA